MNRAFATNEQIAERVATRPPEFWTQFEKTIVERTPDGIWINTDHPIYQELHAKYAPVREYEEDANANPGAQEIIPATPEELPIDRSKWPILIRTIAKLRNEADQGIGDTIARHLDRFGADAYKRIYKAATGKDCGCGDRQSKLNRIYPY